MTRAALPSYERREQTGEGWVVVDEALAAPRREARAV